MPPSRQQIWLVLGIETAFLLILAAWILSRLGRLFEPVGLLVALAIIALGDLVTALVMQRYAPTRITLAPGETGALVGTAMSGFDGDKKGRVLVRGETWEARCAHPGRIAPGDPVRVVSRGGLILHVEPVD